MKRFSIWLLGWNNGDKLPPLVIIASFFTLGILFFPEDFYVLLGIDVGHFFSGLPELLQYQLVDMNNKNAAYVFWLALPFVFLINSAILAIRVNSLRFEAYMRRRVGILKKQGKSADDCNLTVVVGPAIMIVLYSWSLFVARFEPSILGDFVPTKNRIALVLFHGGMVLLILPMGLSVMIAEIRAYLKSRDHVEVNK